METAVETQNETDLLKDIPAADLLKMGLKEIKDYFKHNPLKAKTIGQCPLCLKTENRSGGKVIGASCGVCGACYTTLKDLTGIELWNKIRERFGNGGSPGDSALPSDVADEPGGSSLSPPEPRQYDYFYDRKKETTDVVLMKLNCFSLPAAGESGEVRIVFVNGKFRSAEYPMSGTYTRNGWRILVAIAAEIDKIENNFKKKEIGDV